MKSKSLFFFTLCLLTALTGAVSAHAAANLVITSVSGPAKAYLGTTVYVTCEIQNQGDTESGPFELTLSLTRDEAARFLKQRTFDVGLAAGETKKTVTKVVIPNSYYNGLSGSYFYGAVVLSRAKTSTKQVAFLRYKNNGNGTVTDYKTGAVWQQADDGEFRTWTDAVSYCTGLTLGDHDDWALPSIEILAGIIDFSRYMPSCDSVFACRSGDYWSTSTYADDPDYAWNARFHNGYVTADVKSNAGYVRCVRGGS